MSLFVGSVQYDVDPTHHDWQPVSAHFYAPGVVPEPVSGMQMGARTNLYPTTHAGQMMRTLDLGVEGRAVVVWWVNPL